MYKSAIRSAPRRIVALRSALNTTSSSATRRFLSTAPPSKKSRTWKSSAARWGLAIGGIYFYNTSSVFEEGPEAAIQRLDDSIHYIAESNQPTVDAVVEEKRKRQAQLAAEEQRREAAAATKANANADEQAEGEEGMGGLEEEADQQGAFNPETGEINWDCPCLGGMAHGPCGEEFKAAFSCFVYSNEEPKGMECIDKFKGMQDCFRQHPEMYGSELEDDEDEVEEELHATDGTQPAGESHRDSQGTAVGSAQNTGDESGNLVEKSVRDASTSQTPLQTSSRTAQAGSNASDGKSTESDRGSQHTAAQNAQKPGDEEKDLVPKIAYDASATNKSSK